MSTRGEGRFRFKVDGAPDGSNCFDAASSVQCCGLPFADIGCSPNRARAADFERFGTIDAQDLVRVHGNLHASNSNPNLFRNSVASEIYETLSCIPQEIIFQFK